MAHKRDSVHVPLFQTKQLTSRCTDRHQFFSTVQTGVTSRCRYNYFVRKCLEVLQCDGSDTVDGRSSAFGRQAALRSVAVALGTVAFANDGHFAHKSRSVRTVQSNLTTPKQTCARCTQKIRRSLL